MSYLDVFIGYKVDSKGAKGLKKESKTTKKSSMELKIPPKKEENTCC